MLADKLTLLFGNSVPTDVDLDDMDVLNDCLREAWPATPDHELAGPLRQIIARQILDDDPPLVWETAQRLLTLGLDREAVTRQLVLAFLPSLQAALPEEFEEFEEFEDGSEVSYEALLRQLPLPSAQDVEQTVMALLRAGDPITLDDLDEAVLEELGISTLSTAVESLLDTVMDRMLDDGEIALLPGDFVIAPEQLCRGIVLTTRMTAPAAWPPWDTDFVGFTFLDDEVGDPPPGVEPGQLLVARHRRGGTVVEPAPSVQIRDDEIAEIRRAYEAETAEVGLPVSFGDLLLNLLAEDPNFFEETRAPLSELVAAAGLQIRGDLIAGDDSVWRALAHSRASFSIVDRAEGRQEREDALEIFGVFEAVTDHEPIEAVTTADLRRALDLMAGYNVLSLVTDQFFGKDDDPASIDATDAFARRLSAAASRPLQRAVAAWLTAMVAERRCDPLVAADALAEAVRHVPDFFPAVDRLAWTRSDQGRASEAKALWLQLDVPGNPDLVAIEQATAGQLNPAAGLRRNEPCWCGSGRKYKVCHLRANELPPIPDRFGWLLRKTVGYLERRGAPIHEVVGETAWKLADGQSEKFDEALLDPMVCDLVLHELGWFDRFRAERGPLLPVDEQLLFASWQLVPRTVYEIVDVRHDEGLALRDLRTGDVTDVQERSLTRVISVGQVICARAVPDGRGHQIIGGVFTVPPGYEEMLIDILDDPDPASVADRLLGYRAAASRPPTLTTTEGEPLRRCTLVLQVADPVRTREVLDHAYVSDDPKRWHQAHTVDGQSLIRAMLRLEGSTLTVETMSEERMDRVSAELTDLLPDARLVSEVREDFEIPSGSALPPPAGGAPPQAVHPDMKATLTSWLEQQEERWCSESVPALGGLTPREAADDPTRRESVIRLIDSFGPEGGLTDEGVVTMRPDRLRELLGIS